MHGGEYANPNARQGEVWKVSAPGFKLWRISSAASLPDALGGSWSFQAGDREFKTREAWRQANAVCRVWNPDADYVFECEPKMGTLLLIGPTQSADCVKLGAGDAKYGMHPLPQISLDKSVLDVSACSKPKRVTWPADDAKRVATHGKK